MGQAVTLVFLTEAIICQLFEAEFTFVTLKFFVLVLGAGTNFGKRT
jgi:hypothetical protein